MKKNIIKISLAGVVVGVVVSTRNGKRTMILFFYQPLNTFAAAGGLLARLHVHEQVTHVGVLDAVG